MNKDEKGQVVEMTVSGVAIDPSTRDPIILLQDPSGRRQVPISIDHIQSHNILKRIEGIPSEEASIHDITAAIIQESNLKLINIVIHLTKENDIFAVLKLAKQTSKKINEQNAIELKVKVIDAIALAITVNCQIWVHEEVIAYASIPINKEADKFEQDEFRGFLNRIDATTFIKYLKNDDRDYFN